MKIKYFIIVLAIFIFSFVSLSRAEEALRYSNAGPYILNKILIDYGIKSTDKELIKLSGTNNGKTSLYGLKIAAEKKGLQVFGIKTNLENLKKYIADFKIISLYSKNNNFISIKSVTKDSVEIFDPSIESSSKMYNIPINSFLNEWNGAALLIKKPEPQKTKGVRTAATADSVVQSLGAFQMSASQMQAASGGTPCKNTDASAGNNGGDKSKDPVILNNGDLLAEETDFYINTKGLVPLELSRVYNSQIVSSLEGWIPEGGSGPWALENGEYVGHGDRSSTEKSWSDFTLTLDMKTVEPGPEPWHVAWVNWRYTDPDNCYYLLIKNDSQHTIEFTRKKNGELNRVSFGKASSYDPLSKNTIKIEAIGNHTKIYINNNLEFNYVDPDPVYSGKVALEAHFSYSAFDNVSVADAVNPENNFLSNFNSSDSESPFGNGWTYTYGIKIKEFSNGDAHLIRADAKEDIFVPVSGGAYTSPTGVFDTLTKAATGFSLREKDGTKYNFDLNGRLINIVDRYNNAITMQYGLIEGKERLLSVADPSDRTLTFNYGTNLKVDKVVDPKGREYQYGYDSEGNLTSVRDPKGNYSYYTYYPSGVRESYVDFEGYTYQYEYAYNNRVVKQIDPIGNSTNFNYLWDITMVYYNDDSSKSYTYLFDSSNHKTIEEVDPLTNFRQYAYDENYNRINQKDKRGNLSSFTYDQKGNLLSAKDARNNTASIEYESAFNQPNKITDKKGNITTLAYDPSGSLITKIDAKLNSSTYTYYSYGKLETSIDPAGNATSYEYDQYGNLSKVIDPYGKETVMTYDIIGNLLTITDALGHTTTNEYDLNNNVTKITDAKGNFVSYAYNKNGDKISSTDQNGKTTYFTYDWAGNIVKIKDPKGFETNFTYDTSEYIHLAISRLLLKTDAEGNSTTYDYDSRGRLISETNAENHTITYQYDAENNMTKITDPKGNYKNFDYDELNRLIVTITPDPNPSQKWVSYDANGNIASTNNEANQMVIYEYDSLNKVTKKLYGDGSLDIRYLYDSRGNLVSALSPSGNGSTYTYDKLNRVTSETTNSNIGIKTVSYQYDDVGRRSKLTYPDGSFVTYDYDELNRLIAIRDEAGATIASYTSWPDGKRKSLTYANGITTNYTYDEADNLLAISNQLSAISYTYDKVGNRLQKQHTVQSTQYTENYTYDKIYQLTQVSTSQDHNDTRNYVYDSVGNRISEDTTDSLTNYYTNNLNQYTQVKKTKDTVPIEGTVSNSVTTLDVNGVSALINPDNTFTVPLKLNEGTNSIIATAYDSQGRQGADSISVTLTPKPLTFSYDLKGNLKTRTLADLQTNYTYDYENRLTDVIASPQGEAISYRYDYLGRRIQKNVNGVVTNFVYDGDQLIAEYDNSGVLLCKTIFGPNIDEPILMIKSDGSKYFYHADALGSIINLTDSSGQLVESYDYDIFGNIKSSLSQVGNKLYFTGREFDIESGLYYYRARYYDPKLGRFLQADPLGYSAGINLYSYCGNNSINWVDPSGNVAERLRKAREERDARNQKARDAMNKKFLSSKSDEDLVMGALNARSKGDTAEEEEYIRELARRKGGETIPKDIERLIKNLIGKIPNIGEGLGAIMKGADAADAYLKSETGKGLPYYFGESIKNMWPPYQLEQHFIEQGYIQ